MAKSSVGDGARPSLHGQLLKEALGRLATPEVAERIVALALHEAGLGAVPDDPATLGSFACGALRAAVAETLGDDSAEAIIADLEPAFARAQDQPDSGVRRRGRRSLVGPAPRVPVVVIATEVRAAGDAIASRLRDRVKLVFADDIFGLLQSAQRYGGSRLLLVIHDELPAIRATTLATLGRLLPSSATVVQWGNNETPAPTGEEGLPAWFSLGRVTEPEAIADVCIALLPDEAPPRRVLLAHQDSRYRASEAARLRSAGFDVVEAPDGLVALDRCGVDPPHVLLAPVNLPGLGGMQLAELLEARAGRPPLFVLIGDHPAPGDGVAAVVGDGDDLLEVLRALIDPEA